jgi:hypothetical protein
MQPQSDEVQAEALEVSSEPEPEAPQVKEKNEERATAANVKEPQLTDTNKKKEEEKEDKRKEKKKEKRAGYLSLFRYATPLDRLILLFSTLCAIAAGAALPLVTVSSLSLPQLTNNLGHRVPCLVPRLSQGPLDLHRWRHIRRSQILCRRNHPRSVPP